MTPTPVPDPPDTSSALVQTITLNGHSGWINRLAWSPDGTRLASASNDRTVLIWDLAKPSAPLVIRGHTNVVLCVAWSPDGTRLASCGYDNTIRIWDAGTGVQLRILCGHNFAVDAVLWQDDDTLISSSDDKTIQVWNITDDAYKTQFGWQETLTQHANSVYSLAWSPNKSSFASGSFDGRVIVWDTESKHPRRIFDHHGAPVMCVAWANDGTLASCSHDGTIRIWSPVEPREAQILEGHSGHVRAIAFSPDNSLLASKSADGSVRIWRCDIWEEILSIPERTDKDLWLPGLAFNPKQPILATLDNGDVGIRLWRFDLAMLREMRPSTPQVHYTNAKVVLIGDTGVGKSALAGALTGRQFVPTDSSGARRVLVFENTTVPTSDGRIENRETILWDLGGQPGFRLVQQLQLRGVSLALVVFDAKSETDPFGAVYHWYRALKQAAIADEQVATRKFLVSARMDRGGVQVSSGQIGAVLAECGFEAYYPTSSKAGTGITELREAVRKAIDWEGLPRVTSTELLQNIRLFLIREKLRGRVLTIPDDLFRAFCDKHRLPADAENRAHFDICLGRLESSGLVRRLRFGNFLLLQPEFVDSYASAIIDAARREPQGLGSISEDDVLAGRFPMPDDVRLKDREQEKLLCIATIEDMLRHEIVWRERADDAVLLVFPSQLTRPRADLPDPEGKVVSFCFEGALRNVYATLAVRLSHSDLFTKQDLWKNAVTYTAHSGGTCGIFLRDIEEGKGELTLFFDDDTPPETRQEFEEYVSAHLERHAAEGTVRRRRHYSCPYCRIAFTDEMVAARLARNKEWLTCPVCNKRVPLRDRDRRLPRTQRRSVAVMDDAADAARERETATSIVQGKQATKDFDVFLSYNSKDRAAVVEIAEQLKSRGLLPWIDERNLPPATLLIQCFDELVRCRATVVFWGPHGMGDWMREEVAAALAMSLQEKGRSVVPVLLKGAEISELPPVLRSRRVVDFNSEPPRPIDALVWGIKGGEPPAGTP